MKHLLTLLLVVPFIGYAQRVKVAEYDKFIKQVRVEVEPLPIMTSAKAAIALNYVAIGGNLSVLISGFGWGGNAIDGGNELIFLFANDSTITGKSIGLQTYEVGALHNTFKHQYTISISDLDQLNRYDLVGIRKYSFKDYNDLKVSKETAAKIKKLTSLFIDQLKKMRIIQTNLDIDLTDIAKHIGDSVSFCSKVYRTSRYDGDATRPLMLDVTGNDAQPLNIIIRNELKKDFNNAPEKLYNDRDVCISGMVQLKNNIPEIVIYNRNQLRVTSPIRADEATFFIGDSVKVTGAVKGAKYMATAVNGPTLLNMGSDYPNQAMTVVIDKDYRAAFSGGPETLFLNKEIEVTGKITMYNGKPQIKIYDPAQISQAAFQEPAVAVKESRSNKRRSTNTSTAKNPEPGADSVMVRVINPQKKTDTSFAVSARPTEPAPEKMVKANTPAVNAAPPVKTIKKDAAAADKPVNAVGKTRQKDSVLTVKTSNQPEKKTPVTAPVATGNNSARIVPPDTAQAVGNVTPAGFPGGAQALASFFKENIRPQSFVKAGTKASVFVNFDVDAQGAVDNFRVLYSGSQMLDTEAMRVLKLMPAWTPATVNGKPRSSIVTQEISFTSIGKALNE